MSDREILFQDLRIIYELVTGDDLPRSQVEDYDYFIELPEVPE